MIPGENAQVCTVCATFSIKLQPQWHKARIQMFWRSNQIFVLIFKTQVCLPDSGKTLKSCWVLTLTGTLIIIFFLLYTCPSTSLESQPLNFNGGFNTWMGIESLLGSHAGFIPPTLIGSDKIWTAAQYFRGKRLNWFFSAKSIPWKLGLLVCMSSSMYLYVMRVFKWVWSVVIEINMLASGFCLCFSPSMHTPAMNTISSQEQLSS